MHPELPTPLCHIIDRVISRRSSLAALLATMLVLPTRPFAAQETAARKKRRKNRKKRCKGGTAKCGKQFADLATNAANCGACGQACLSGECIHGACTCTAAEDCGGECFCKESVANGFFCKDADCIPFCGPGAACMVCAECLEINELGTACAGLTDGECEFP